MSRACVHCILTAKQIAFLTQMMVASNSKTYGLNGVVLAKCLNDVGHAHTFMAYIVQPVTSGRYKVFLSTEQELG